MVSLASRAIEQRPTEAEYPGLKVLAVIDGTERTGRIVVCAVRLGSRSLGLQVVVLGVVPEPDTGRLRGYGSFKQAEIYGKLIDTMRQRVVAAVARRLDREKIAHVDRVEVADPVATILSVAQAEDADLILIGGGPPGMVQRLLSAIGLSVPTGASRVVQLATVPVVVVR